MVLVSFIAPRLAEDQLVIPHSMFLKPGQSSFSMFFCSSREEADEVALVMPLVDLCDRVRICLRGSHPPRIPLAHILAASPPTSDTDPPPHPLSSSHSPP